MAPKRRKPFFIRGTYFDYPSLFFILFLVFFGVMMVYSSSSFVSYRLFNNNTHYLFRQIFFGMLGIMVMFGVSKIRYQVLRRFSYIGVLGIAILLIIVLVGGQSVNGSSRWINLGFISFQPSEIAKIVVVLYMAYICSEKPELLRSIKGTVIAFAPAAGVVILIAIENLSTAIICALIAGGIWFVATPKMKYVVVMLVVGVLFVIVMISMQGYRGERIQAWRNPEASSSGFQTLQGLYAIGSGGLFGRGLGQSIQKMGNIPEAQNDMIFSIICEELGIVGAVGLILVFVMLIWRFRFIAEGAPDRYGSLIVIGVISHLAFQVLINMFVVTNLMPNTGVPLPFISYGGTSLVFLLIEMGIVLAVSRQIEPLGSEEEKEA